jgi:hypothetical protein
MDGVFVIMVKGGRIPLNRKCGNSLAGLFPNSGWYTGLVIFEVLHWKNVNFGVKWRDHSEGIRCTRFGFGVVDSAVI